MIPLRMLVMWYERKEDFSPDYTKDHTIVFKGNTPYECMDQFHELQKNQDLYKYTMPEIVSISY